MFNEAIKINFTLSSDSCTTDRRMVNTRLEYQLHIGSSSNISSPNYLIAAHETEARTKVPNKANKIAVFDHLDARK